MSYPSPGVSGRAGRAPERISGSPKVPPTFAVGARITIQTVSDSHKHISEKAVASPLEKSLRERRGGDQDGGGES